MTESMYPPVYQVGLEQSSVEELLQFYAMEVLRDACSAAIESSFTTYITRIVEPVGWTAVWRATTNSSQLPYECDFVVETRDVSLSHLEADVVIKKVLCCVDPITNEDKDYEELENIIGDTKTVPLIELYPVCDGDDDEQFLETAIAIEHVRFFYKNIWRPWDDENEDEDIFIEKYFAPRLKLYFDIKNKVLPEALTTRVVEILKEGWEVREDLTTLLNEMNVSDSEAELNEKDVLKTMQLRIKMENLQREMEMLEDPLIRSLMMKKEISQKSPVRDQRKKSKSVTHFVAEEFTYGMLKDINLDPKTVMKFHSTLLSAVAESCSGDEILILPGYYKCDSFDWFEEEVTIKGLGVGDDVILDAVGSGDIFINCNSSKLIMKNLLIKTTVNKLCTILIHKGKLEMYNCTVEGAKSNCCITVLGGAEGKLLNCKVSYSEGDGIQLRSFGRLDLNSCSVFGCKGNGLQICGDEKLKDANEKSVLNLVQTSIYENDGYGINLTVIDESCKSCDVESKSNAESILSRISWMTSSVEDLSLHDNQGDISITSTSKADNLFKMAESSDPYIPVYSVNIENVNRNINSELQ